MKQHRFKSNLKGGRKGRKGQTKSIRFGSRHPGGGIGKALKQGSIHHPF